MQPSMYPYLLACAVGMGLVMCAPRAQADAWVLDPVSFDSIRISDLPCTNPDVLRFLPDGGAKHYAAYTYIGKRQRNACWTYVAKKAGEAEIHVTMDNGRRLRLSAGVFSEAAAA